jgi:hypothetical protein
LRRGAPQRLIFHWEGNIYCKDLKYFKTIHPIYTLLKHDFKQKDVILNIHVILDFIGKNIMADIIQEVVKNVKQALPNITPNPPSLKSESQPTT